MLLESGGIFAMEYPQHAITQRLRETVQAITTPPL
jgi:hypothetical protein